MQQITNNSVTGNSSTADQEVLVRVEGVSKKFCRSLKKSLWYGLCDIAGELSPFGRRDIAGLSVSGETLLGGRSPQLSVKSDELLGDPNDDSQITTNTPGHPPGGITNNSSALRPGEFWAVNDVSFELRRGECLGLIGHNGAGKTTLLKMLNGLIKPDAGTITMRGRVGALIALGAGFNPILTGRENIYINGSVLGLSKKEIDGKIDEIIDFAEIGEFIDMPVQNYSSGMQVRLGFSIASSLSPDVLILDEVLAVGDIGFVIKCLNRVRELSSNAAVILVSHSMQSVAWFCTRVIFMEGGRAELDTRDTSVAIDRYFALVGDQRNLSGLGGVRVDEVAIRPAADEPFSTVDVFAHGAEAFIDLEFTVDLEDEPVAVVVAIDDASASQVICFPLVDAEGADKQFGKGNYSVSISLGKLELNSGKYSVLAWATGAKSRRQFVRSAGNCSFRVTAPKHLWTRLVRPVEPIVG